MAVKHPVEEIFDLEEDYLPPYEVVADNIALEFQLSVLERLRHVGMTQKDLAQRMGVSAPTLSSMLRKGANLTIKTVCRIACGLGCAISAPALEPLAEDGAYSALREEMKEGVGAFFFPSGRNLSIVNDGYSTSLSGCMVQRADLPDKESNARQHVRTADANLGLAVAA